MPHPAEVEQISDVAPPAKISMSSGRGLGLFGWAVSLGVSLVVECFAIGFWDFVLAQFARNTILGWVLSRLAATFVTIILALIIRDFFVIARMRNMERLGKRIEAVVSTQDVAETRRIVSNLNRIYGRRSHLTSICRDQVQAAKDSVDPNAMLSRYETDVIATLDKEAQKEIERAARQVATVTAMVPTPWIDMLAAFGTNLRLIRRIGEIYGGRSGPIGSWHLLRSVSAHLIATEALAVGDDWLGSVFGGSLLSRLSRRFGEGLVNATLTARVGRAAIDVCRPLPFNMQERPKISVVLRRALTGIFDETPD
jgi:putative membrane protein